MNLKIKNLIYAGQLAEAIKHTNQLSHSDNPHNKQLANLFFAQIAYQKGNLKQMHSYLPRITDEYSDISYYKNIMYGHYLILNNQKKLGFDNIKKTINSNQFSNNLRVQIDNDFSRLYLLSNGYQTKVSDKEKIKQIFSHLKTNEDRMLLFEKSQYYANQAFFCPKKDTTGTRLIAEKLINFGDKNNFYSSKIIGLIILSNIEKVSKKKLALLKSALKHSNSSQLIHLNLKIHTSLVSYYTENGDFDSAIFWCKKSITPSILERNIYSGVHAQLSELYELKGNYKKAIEYKKVDIENYREVSQKQSNNIREYLVNGLNSDLKEKNKLLRRNRSLIWGISIFSGLLLILLYYILSLQKKLKKALEEINESKIQTETFARILSHDLKVPLYSITKLIGSVLQNDKELNFTSKSYLIAARDACENSNVFINNIMTFIRQKERKVEFKETSLRKIIDTAKQNLKEQISNNNVLISEQNLPTTLFVNGVLFIQLFQNLLQNSIKYRQLELDSIIAIKYETTPNGYKFKIRDNGIGIPEEKADVLFKAFEQEVHYSIDQGVGLGLAISSVIVRLHNGKISVKNNKKSGVTVELEFSNDLKK